MCVKIMGLCQDQISLSKQNLFFLLIHNRIYLVFSVAIIMKFLLFWVALFPSEIAQNVKNWHSVNWQLYHFQVTFLPERNWHQDSVSIEGSVFAQECPEI